MRSLQVYLLLSRRQRRQTRRVRSLLRRGQRIALGAFAVILLGGLGLLTAAAVWYAELTTSLPPVSQIEELLDPAGGLFLQPTRVYDRTGQHLLLALENPGVARRYLKSDPAEPDHFSPELVRVTIGLLDPGFWQHPGFLWSNLTDPQPATIAERLAADLLLAPEPPGLRRTLRMRILAAQLVSQEGRPRVLEWYLNSASFGHLAYGAESAARLYLDKSATDLTLAEAALLVPLTAAPALNPLDAYTAALERRDAALAILLEQGGISQEEYQRALDSRPRQPALKNESASAAPAFTDLAIARAAHALGQSRLERGGLRLITTLDYDLQTQAVCLLKTQLNRLGGRAETAAAPDGGECKAARLLPTLAEDTVLPDGLAASLVLLDPRSGEVLALVGDTRRAGGEGSLLPHAPGSLLAPFAAVAEFARGYSPASLVWDIPPADVSEQVVRLNAGQYRGPLRLRQAIANDTLTPQIDLIERLGGVYVWRLAASLGLAGMADERDAAALRAGPPLSPLEVAAGYAVFAAQGTANGQIMGGEENGTPSPNPLLYIEDTSQNLLLDFSQPRNQPLLSPALAYLVHAVLADEPARWPSLGFPNPLEIGRPAGAKVGSALEGRQAWTAGYTPQRLGLIWLGLDAESPARVDPLQAAAVWHALMQYANRDLAAEDWPVPPGLSRITVCDPSGQLPTPACPAVVEEIFLNGNEPVSPDTLYRSVQVNRETGRLATVFTPPALVEERVYLAAPPEARLWAEAAGLSLAPEVYDIIQPPDPSAQVRLDSPALFAYVSGQVEVRGSAAGKDFISYRLQAGEGLNPQSWLQIGEESRAPVEEGVLGVWDTSGLDGLYALRLVVVRSDSQVENAIIQVTVDNTPPLARITYPVDGQEFTLAEDRAVSFLAEVSDGVGVARLEWLLDGKPLGETLVPPYSLPWKTAAGEHVLVVRAVDLAGNVSESVAVPFSVSR